MKSTLLLLALTHLPVAGWAFECVALQATVARIRLNAPAIADGTFQPYAPRPLPAAACAFQWADTPLYLPVAPYQCTPRWNATDKQMSVIFLVGATHTLGILGPMEGAAPLDDVFAMTGEGPADADRVEATRRLFGKSPNLFDLEEIAWTVDASKFTCTADTVEAAMRDSIALIIKTIASPAGDIVAHKNVGLTPSHLLLSSASKRHLMEYHWRAVDGRYWSLSALGGDAAFVSAATALVPSLGGKAPVPTEPLPGLCAGVIELANTPSPAKATALKTRAAAAGDTRLVEALDAYLKAP